MCNEGMNQLILYPSSGYMTIMHLYFVEPRGRGEGTGDRLHNEHEGRALYVREM